jgi:hypothetical protein
MITSSHHLSAIEDIGMTAPSLASLRDAADQLVVLAGTFQLPGHSLRAQHIRKAEKNLVTLESLFSHEMGLEAKQWHQNHNALHILRERRAQVEKIDAEISQCTAKITEFESSTQQWFALTTAEREKIVQQAKTAKHYLENKIFQPEAHILHKFQRYDALKALVPYADNADYLCEAIHHYENRVKYEESIKRLENKKEQAHLRLRSVQRGFYLATSLCILIVTLPICAPFAFSLWSRRREIQSQIANIEETIRRESRRLEAADEGAVASQEIREILGQVSLDQVKRTLNELKDLRSEFQRPQKTSVSASLLSFLDLYRIRLQQLFGDLPKEPLDVFQWLVERVFEAQNIQSDIDRWVEERNVFSDQKRQLLRGHSLRILQESIENLEHMQERNFLFPLTDEMKSEFARICSSLPALLTNAREVLSIVSHGQTVDEGYVQNLHMYLMSAANILNSCVLDSEIAEVWDDAEIANAHPLWPAEI